MNRILVLVLGMLAAAGAACAVPLPTAAPSTAASASANPGKSGTIRFSSNGEVDVLDVPRLMVLDALKEQGYTVEQTIFASSDQITVALDRGEIEFGSADASTSWAAIAKGADLVTIVGRAHTTFNLVTKQEFQSCSDLNGRPIALNSTTSVGYGMVQTYLKQNCPDSTPELLVVNSSSSRVAAMQSGKVDGAWVELAVWLRFNRQAPGKFRPFIEFAKAFPQVQYTVFSVQKSWAEQNPEIVKDYIRALLTAQRRIKANPQLLRDEIIKYVSLDRASAQEAADAYLALGAWSPNGGLTTENLKSTLDLLTSSGNLSPGLTPERVADLSYLNAVLGELGRE